MRRGVVANCLDGPKKGTWLELKGTPSQIRFKSGAVYVLCGPGDGVTYYRFDIFSLPPVNNYPNPYTRIDNVCTRCDGRGWFEFVTEDFFYRRKNCGYCHGTGVKVKAKVDVNYVVLDKEIVL